MKATCGIYCLNKNNQLLINHPINAKNIGCWSIPKGVPNDNEPYFDAAKREFDEETGLYLYNQDLIAVLPVSEYKSKSKRLYSFYFRCENFEMDTPIVCSSFIRNGDPENDISMWIDINNPVLDKLLHESQINNLNIIREWVNKN